MKLAIIAVVIAFVIVLLFTIQYLPDLKPSFLKTASITVWRGIDCTIDCRQHVDSAIISKYPELQNAVEQIDQRYEGQFSKVCDTNECLNEQFPSGRIAFTVREDIASQMSKDLAGAGATNIEEYACFDLPCHWLGFNIENATYEVGFIFDG